MVLKAHMEGCVRSALAGGSADADKKIEELVSVFDKLSK
jgi:DNA-binding FrmR family transcriptional regulator